jgi:hypothetical protein
MSHAAAAQRQSYRVIHDPDLHGGGGERRLVHFDGLVRTSSFTLSLSLSLVRSLIRALSLVCWGVCGHVVVANIFYYK